MDRKTKRELREKSTAKPSDIQFASIIEKINEGFVALDAQMNYLYINKRGSELLRREPENLIGKNYWDEYPEDKNTSFGQAYLRALETRTAIELEDYYAERDRWFENRVYPSDEGGLSIFFNDITERKRAEAGMRENEERFQTLANGSPILLWVNGLEGSEFVNREYLDFLGLDPQTDVRSYDWSEFVHPEDREAYQNTYLRAFENQTEFSTEFRFRRYDGEYRWMRSEATPRRAADGSFAGYVGASIDITVRKQAELAMQNSEHQLRLITDAMPALISYIDSEFRYRFVNQAYRDWFGYENQEVIDRTAMDVLGAAAFERLRPHMEAALAGKTEIFESETPYQRGGTRFIRATYTPDIAADGAINGFFVLVLDITERKQAEEALAEYGRQQAALYQLTDQLQQSKTLEDTFNAALDAILSALQCQRASILLLDKADVMRFVAWRGLSDDYRTATDGHSPWKPDAKNPEPISMNDIHTAELSDSLKSMIRNEGIGSLAFIPLVFNGKLIGKFMTYFNEPHEFTEREIDLSLTIAHQLAIGIERKREENALRTSEERLRLATQAARMFTWELDIRTQVSTVADNFADALGFSPDLIPKDNEDLLEQFIHPDDRQVILEALTEVVRNHKDVFSMQYRILNPENGQPIWLDVNGKVIYDSNGNAERMFGVAQNITERKDNEQQLIEKARLLDLSNDAIIVRDSTDRIVYWNRGAEQVYGWKHEEVLGKVSHEILQTEHPEPLKQILDHLLRDGHWSGELLHTRRDGKQIATFSRWSPDRDSQGQLVSILETNNDITARKQADRHLAMLADVSELTRQIEDPVELMYAVAKAVGQHLQVKRCLFNETDVERDLEIVHKDFHDGVESVAGEHRISDYSSVTSAEMMAGKTVVNHDSKVDPRTEQDYERTYELSGERAYVAVPLMRENRWVGTLWVSDDEPRQWSQEEVSLLETVAERTWAAVERTRAEEALAKSEAKYRTLFNSMDEGYCVIEFFDGPHGQLSDYVHVEANPAYTANAGIPDIVGKKVREMVPDEADGWVEIYRNVLITGQPVQFERELVATGRHLELSAFRIEPAERRQVAVMFKNITERKRMENEKAQLLEREQAQRISAEEAKLEAEQAKAEAERELAERRMAEAALGEWADAPLPQDKRSAGLRYGAAFVATLVAILARLVLDPFLGNALELVTIYAAVAFSVWFGGVGPALLSALLGYLAISGLIVEPRGVVILDAQTITGFALFLFSNTVVMALGETMRRAQRHAHQSARVAIERQLQAEAQLQEKKLAEASLRQSEALYRAIANGIPGGGVYVVDTDFRYQVVEGSVTEAFELSREMLEGHTVAEVFTKEQAERMEDRLRRNFAGETVDYETRFKDRVYWTQQAPLRDSTEQVLIVTIDITERKLAEEALKRSEERFARFMQYLPGLAWIKDTDGRYIYANEAASRVFNTPIDELYGKTDEEIFPAEVAAQFRNNDELALMDEKGVQVTETLKHQDGQLHYSLVSKFPIPGPDGSTTLIGGTAFDITERLQAEEALRESEARLRAVFDGTYEYIGLLSPEGTLLEANRAALEFDHNTREEVIGRPFWETPWWAYTPGAQESLRNAIERAANGEPIRYEAPLNRRSGETIIFDFSLHPVRDEQGEVMFLVPEGRNITERKKAEDALYESEERFRAILGQATAGIVRKDAEGRLIFVNQAFCNMLGLTEADLLGKTIWDFTHPDDLEQNKRLYERTMIEGVPFKLEKRLIRADGSIVWVDVSVSPILDVNGKPQSAVAVEVDITGRKQAEHALRESEERYRALFNSIDEGFCVIEKVTGEGDEPIDFRYIEANPAFAANAGRDNVVGQTIREAYPGEAEEWFQTYDTVLRTGESMRFERGLVTQGRVLELYAFRVKDET
ncbi:MAG TPA: PAS domain S-box protein, partial [Anaerolineales bacterium]|nr:PAS domain S-box protein [Anaerolineales bacterium]